MHVKKLISLVAGLWLLAVTAQAEDSPQFRGPDRTGVFPETGLMQAWPEGGPAQLWVAKGLGAGYSSASVANGAIYVTGMTGEDEGNLFVLNLDGKIERTIPYGKETTDKQAPGPRSTPTIDGDRLYLLSAVGVVYCIDLVKGEKLWEVNILDRFGAENITWALAESVLVDGDRVICTPGGPDAGVVALNKMTGETVWTTKGLSDAASYCSPIIVNHNGRRILLTETAKLVVGLDANDGTLLWTYDHPTEYDIHAVTPIYKDGLVYFSGGYGSGGGALELSPDGSAVTLKWADTTLDCQHHGVVLVGGYLYGTASKKPELVCLEMATGKVMWTTREIRQGAVVAAEGMLYVYEGPKSGVVSLVKASPSGFERTGMFKVTEGNGNHWAHPTIANGRLYIRHGDALLAYDIK
jgi:outer membrane protein assembly factor BamB